MIRAIRPSNKHIVLEIKINALMHVRVRVWRTIKLNHKKVIPFVKVKHQFIHVGSFLELHQIEFQITLRNFHENTRNYNSFGPLPGLLIKQKLHNLQ